MSDSQQTLPQQTGDGAPPANEDDLDTEVAIDRFESALLKGDVSKLNRQERKDYYEELCASLDLNPLTQPFEYIRLQGQLTLYANKTAAAQLRKNFRISITEVEEEQKWGLFIARAYAKTPDGRTDVDEGTVAVGNASGEALANIRMKAITKAKRRVTLSICGLGFLDEEEVESTPGAEPVEVENGEIVEADQAPRDTSSNGVNEALGLSEEDTTSSTTIGERKQQDLYAVAKGQGGYTEEGVQALLEDYGFDSTKDVTEEVYESIMDDAKSEPKAAEYNPTEEESGGDVEPSVNRFGETLTPANAEKVDNWNQILEDKTGDELSKGLNTAEETAQDWPEDAPVRKAMMAMLSQHYERLDEPDELPDGMTGRNFLVGAGIETVEHLRGIVEDDDKDLTDYDGIGSVTAKSARQWVENNG